MRSTLDAKNMGHAIMALRTERWSYIAALAAVSILLILFISSVIVNIYSISNIAVKASENNAQIAILHTTIKPSISKNANTIISQLELFGAPPASISNVTNSNFTLLGIEYSAKDPSNARAIISTNSGDDEIYGVGDKLASGVIIDSIGEDNVILMQNGVKQKLTLSWEGNELITHEQEPPEDLNETATPGNQENIPVPNQHNLRNKYLQQMLQGGQE